ncbi:hypothetical protein B0H10DRAFT_1016318 [Mycena sp. CBHHK59/15]|nr:hypothetical protein B0H10DRAFT_1016318 [Mycena sp. CBHHK59/15]
MSTSERSLLVTVSAHAMSSVGFSVSILAWLWLTLIFPFAKIEPQEPIVVVDKKARRRSAPAALQSSSKRKSVSPAPHPPPSPVPSPVRTRRVYFADSPISPSRPTNERNDSSDLSFTASSVFETSPASSSSTLVHTHTAIPPQTLETCRESAIESDSSSSSQRPSLSLLTPPMSNQAHRSSATAVPDTTPTWTPPNSKHFRRSSIGFIPPWSFARRASGPRSVTSPSRVQPSATPSSASPTPAPASSYFTRKNARRVSTPVARTQPYAHPYYAQPPVEDEGYIAYLRGLPQFGSAEPVARSPTTSDSEKEKDPASLFDCRGRDRKANDKAQAALGLGQRPTAQRSTSERVPPQRSASESWADGKALRHGKRYTL